MTGLSRLSHRFLKLIRNRIPDMGRRPVITIDDALLQVDGSRDPPDHEAIGVALWRSKPLAARAALEALSIEADRLRDKGQAAAAAACYAKAFELSPWRNDLRVQQGNMLKDLGNLEDARLIYMKAAEAAPEDADIHLQIGHVLKLMGRRNESLASYRRALELDPSSKSAHIELFQAGLPQYQKETANAQTYAHGIEILRQVSSELTAMRERLASLEQRLPDVATWSSIPVESYSLFRRLFDLPVPPRVEVGIDIRVVIDVQGQSAAAIHQQIRSLQAQTIERWQAVFFGTDPTLAAAVLRLQRSDPRLQWQAASTGESSSAQEMRAARGSGGWLLLTGLGAWLHPEALAWTQYFAALSRADLIYYDAELHRLGARDPDTATALVARWSFDREILSQANLFGETIAVRAAFHERIGLTEPEPCELSFRRSSLLLAAAAGQAQITHLPLPLIHAPAPAAGTNAAGLAAHAEAVRSMLDRIEPGTSIVLPDAEDAPRLRVVRAVATRAAPITVIIATKDNARCCDTMVESLFELASVRDALRVNVIDNGSRNDADREILGQVAGRPGVSVIRRDEPFNWSRLNNLAAASAATPLVIFANDDMEMLSQGWDEIVRGELGRPHVGALGAKLLYPDNTIQHGGILFGWQGSVIHDGLCRPRDAQDQLMRWQLTREVGAVTGAFLAMRCAEFLAAGGFDEACLPIGYSDVDLCLRLRSRARTILWTPDIVVRHEETKSRGLDHLDDERTARDREERRLMTARWGSAFTGPDATVNPTWHDATLPHRLLRPVSAGDIIDYERASRAFPGLCVEKELGDR